MLAEAVHSVADTGNQALLLLGMRLAKRHDPDRYPLGRHKEVYFWAFVVALMLFSLGGVHAIYQGVHKLRQGHEEAGPVLPSVIVLGISVVLEFSSFAVAWREFRKANANRRLGEALFGGRDPTVTVVLLEDTGALLGLAIALCAVVWSHVSKSSAPDAIGSIVIGVLLCAIGVALAAHTHSLLLGVTATPEMRRQAEQNRPAHGGRRSRYPASHHASRPRRDPACIEGAISRRNARGRCRTGNRFHRSASARRVAADAAHFRRGRRPLRRRARPCDAFQARPEEQAHHCPFLLRRHRSQTRLRGPFAARLQRSLRESRGRRSQRSTATFRPRA